MDTNRLKRFAQYARRSLIEQVKTQLKLVLAPESAARREYPEAMRKLEERLEGESGESLTEEVAYTWFNRFCALRFMDVRGYNRVRVVSPLEGQFQPEILAEAKMGHIDEELVSEKIGQRILGLLAGSEPSADPQTEAYRLLIVAVCNGYQRVMPYLFEQIDDYTELLMPDDLLSGNSILAFTREAMTPENCQDVEVIGWLYQFYISEKKDQVFADLKKNKKISPENIPAATQLFTPHWIVRYLVENSLGRLWMLNRPQSKLIDRMEYYIQPEQGETDFLRVGSPEEIKVCDPACGSGHMLTYGFDLLYAIYEEEGYEPSQIPGLILTHNLYGVEIDQRAGALAAFALTMKAREKQRRFFRKPIQPHICVLEPITFAEGELAAYMDFVGRDLFTAPLQDLLHQFEEADNFGALIRPVVTQVQDILALLSERDVAGQLLLYKTHEKVLKVLTQADYLSSKYQVVVANPPYMGGKGMNARLSAWVKDNYPSSKSDLFAAFVERILDLVIPKGLLGFMTPFTWMFLSSYEKLRLLILNKNTLTSLIRPEYHAFFDSAYVPLCAFTLDRNHNPNYKGAFIDLQDFYGADLQPIKALEAIANQNCGWFYRASANDFKKIPGSAIAYWASQKVREIFDSSCYLSQEADIGKGLDTGDNNRFLRLWFEVSLENKKWAKCQKGGPYRKWYGNHDYLINWNLEGQELKNFPGSNLRNSHNYFKSGLSWTRISSSNTAFRFFPEGFIFESTGPCLFSMSISVYILIGFLNSHVTTKFLNIIAPTLDFQSGHISKLPILTKHNFEDDSIEKTTKKSIKITKTDWDSYETSWDFTQLPLISYPSPVNSEQSITTFRIAKTLAEQYQNIRQQWAEMTLEMQKLEEENNCIFIEAYGLQDELSPEVPLKEITLTCNPYYRYSDNKTEAELETLLLSDTIKEFISYGVGCMFGRYSLDKPGLILANQGQTIEDYLQQIPNPTFYADRDNVIPILEGDWFADDITEQFRKFLKITFGQTNYQENLNFIEQALGKDIRKYFLKDFYTDHIKRYKKRPIYWLFSSPQGNFNALIYLHRYRPDTVSIILNDYLREFCTKLTARQDNLKQTSISESASPAERTKALKEVEKLKKILKELDDYEREIIYPLAAQQLDLDLDDGVKVNYPKFGKALKKITGLD